MHRRDFLQVSLVGGGALFVGCTSAATVRMRDAAGQRGVFQPTAFLTITPDDVVRVGVGKSEMGQGAFMAHALLVAEELEVPLERVEPFHASGPDFQFLGVQITGGSTTTKEAWTPVRTGAAAARQMLVAAAAATWGVAARECSAAGGRVQHAASERSLRYGELLVAAAAQPIPEAPRLKAPDEFRVLGKPHRRLDLMPKITGAPVYGIDVDMPGLLRAVVIHAPVLGARATSVDAAGARQMPGVVDIFAFEAGVAVVAEKYWQARRAAPAVKVEWESTPLDRLDTTEMLARAVERSKQRGRPQRDDGDVERAFEVDGGRAVEAVYTAPYLAHAPLEPQNATAHVQDERVDVWAPTQFQSGAQVVAANLTGVDRDDVHVHTTFLGGGFGRRSATDLIVEAVLVSKHVGRPVQVLWSREDDTRGGYYRPLMLARMRGCLDADGRPSGLTCHAMSQSALNIRAIIPGFLPDWLPPRMIARAAGHLEMSDTLPNFLATEGIADTTYAIPNLRVDYTQIRTDIPCTFWRSVGHSVNAFAMESFIDELAHASGKDPLDFRRSLLAGDARKLAVLEAAARLGEWGAPVGEGWGRGIAAHKSFGSYCAQVVEAGVHGGRIVVRRVSCAIDPGFVLDPDIVTAQMESGIIFGLSAALMQRLDIAEGRVRQGNFDTYPMLRMHETPEIRVEILKSTEAPTGVGEPGLPPVAPALAGALFAATGKRLRSLPLRDALKEATG